MILVDTSIWIDYFVNVDAYPVIDTLIRENLVCTNDLVLAELTPTIRIRNEGELIESLNSFPKFELQIDWADIIDMHVINLRNGLHGVGIPDLIIAENAMAHNLLLFTKDKHFHFMSKHFSLRLFDDT